MRIRIKPGQLSGRVELPLSKSLGHRALLAAAVADRPTLLKGRYDAEDLRVTEEALTALGARVEQTGEGLLIRPLPFESDRSEGRRTAGRPIPIDCRESGTSLRLLLPLIGALGAEAVIRMGPGLSKRPIDELLAELRTHGMQIECEREALLVRGKLRGGDFHLPGDVSSQYITALLMVMPLLKEESTLSVSGKLSSASYVDLTIDLMREFGLKVQRRDSIFRAEGRYSSPGSYEAEADFSAAAYWICANAFGSDLKTDGLNWNSSQPDRVCGNLIRKIKRTAKTDERIPLVIDIDPCPDLLPLLAVAAAAATGEVQFVNAARLRLKESDRLESTAAMLKSLGAAFSLEGDELFVCGKGRLSGGITDSCNDHRIAMSAAIAGTLCENDTVIEGAECVSKSYPAFWKEFRKAGGICLEERTVHA